MTPILAALVVAAVLVTALSLVGVPLWLVYSHFADDLVRSRTPGGSTNADGGSPQTPSARWTGAESPEAVEIRPVHPNLVGAPSRKPAAPTRPQAPVDTGCCPAPVSTGPSSPPSPQTLAGTLTGTPLPVRARQAGLRHGGSRG